MAVQELDARMDRMDALLTRLEGLLQALGTAVSTLSQPSGASDRILPWQPVAQTPEEKAEEQKKIDAIIEKALAERQEPLPLAD